MKCPECGHDCWDTYPGSLAFHTGGLTVRCASSANGLNQCGFAIHLTRELMIEAAFLLTQNDRRAASKGVE